MEIRKTRNTYKPDKSEWRQHDPPFYKRTKWKKCRNAVLKREPLCRICKDSGALTPATCVDHILPRSLGGSEYGFENLQPLCYSCHNKKTRREQLNS